MDVPAGVASVNIPFNISLISETKHGSINKRNNRMRVLCHHSHFVPLFFFFCFCHPDYYLRCHMLPRIELGNEYSTVWVKNQSLVLDHFEFFVTIIAAVDSPSGTLRFSYHHHPCDYAVAVILKLIWLIWTGQIGVVGLPEPETETNVVVAAILGTLGVVVVLGTTLAVVFKAKITAILTKVAQPQVGAN
jgi:hypothetical protein